MCAACLDLHKLRHCILIPSLCIYLRFWPLTFYDSDNRYLDGRGWRGVARRPAVWGAINQIFIWPMVPASSVRAQMAELYVKANRSLVGKAIAGRA